MGKDRGWGALSAAYARQFSDYKAAMSSFESAGGRLPAESVLEHHFECLQDWSVFGDLEDVKRWFVNLRETCPMIVREIPLKECRGWQIDPSTGNVAHETGQYFSVHGIRASATVMREVGGDGWDQPILRQTEYDGGILGLLRQRFAGIPHYLVEAKAEPGNYGKLQLSPTLQATFSNLRREHSGRRPHFADYFETPDRVGAKVLYRAWVAEDGGRLFLKRNCAMLVEVDESVRIDVPSGFRWMSMYQIKSLLHEDAWVNPHIRAIIAHL